MNTRERTRYTWEFKPGEGDAYQVLECETTSWLLATESGYYRVAGEYGFCTFESAPVSLKFTTDEVFVPNVFTPNGDDKNPVLKVQTNSAISRFSIFNRFGDEIYSSASGEWDGGTAPAGVYYWYLTYNGCDALKELRGWVQVRR